MKSPWQLGLLALAVTGVSTYDIVFFMNRSQTSEPAQQQALSFTTAPELSAPAIDAQANASSFLPISKDELFMLSRQAYKPSTEETASKDGWPARDPFSDHMRTNPAPVKIPELMPIKTPVLVAAAPMPEEPRCVFSGALIQSDNRLAIIDGNTVSIGAHWGIWRLSRIETDHIILEAGKETHRIELHNNESPSSQERNKS